MLEELAYMLLRGFIIGVVVSAPMGPVGIFCIQRTLDKGRLSGFYTGVGAAVSDLIYCLLTGFGLSFIEEFINTNRSPIQFFGACVLIAFGIWLIRKRPSGTVCADAAEGNPSREGDILKGFALTFSNPLILFLIIGLFAQFNFVIEGMKFYHYVLGFVGIFSGALGWWWVVTYFVDKLRGHFNSRTMKLINTCVGIIILIFAAVGIVGSVTMSAEVIPQPRVSTSLKSAVAGFRVSDNAMKGWRAEFADTAGCGFVLEVRPESAVDAFGDSDVDVLSVSVRDIVSGSALGKVSVSEGVDPYKGKNSWCVARSGDTWSVLAGNREYRQVLAFTHQMDVPLMPSVEAAPRGDISVSMLHMDVGADVFGKCMYGDIDALLQSLQGNKTSLYGVYSLFDHEHDDSYAVIGGDYRIAVAPPADGTDGAIVVYLSGARTLSGRWLPGMKKAFLKATPFAGIYNVEWTDAEGEVMLNDVQAEFDPLSLTLTVKFPYQNTLMRFRKE